jgi:indolepyruvate ferredoxin oxidoreductase beta subunit
VLPYRLVAPFARWAERRWPHGRPTLGQHVRTTTITGFLRVWMLTWLRPLRPISWRAHEEHARMERWLAAVRAAAGRDDVLAAEVARLAQLVKGYGDVRRRLISVFDVALATVLRAAEADVSFATALASRLRTLVLEGPDAESRAEALAAAVRARLEADDLTGARALLTA